MAGTLCLSGALLLKAGKNVSADMKTDANCVSLINQAESFLNVLSKHNWIDNYATLNADVKLILEEAVSCLGAIYAIQYDMSGFTTRIEAEDMITILYKRAMDCVELLKSQDYVKYMTGA